MQWRSRRTHWPGGVSRKSFLLFFFSSRRRHTRCLSDWSSDVCSSDLLMFIAAMHNGISRLYETFGNGGADTEERSLRPNEYARTWFKQNPPLPKTQWSQRNNNNYEQTGVLTALHYSAGNNKLFLRNFYLKAKRSIEKPRTEGPAAYVFPGDDPRPGAQ